MRALKIAGAAVAAVIVVAALLMIIGIPSGFMTSAIQARIERETGYRLAIAGSTKVGFWPSLNVTLNDVTLEAPKDRESSNRVTVASIQADVTLKSVWAGRPQVTDLVIHRPVLYVPLLRERLGPSNPPSRQGSSSAGADANSPMINRVTITDGAVVFSHARDRVENRIDGVNADIQIGGDRKIKVTGSAQADGRPLKFDIKAAMPPPPLERQNVPMELTFDAPSILQAPLSARAEVRLNGQIVMINGLTGTLGDAAFNGWASVDTTSKPLVKLDLDFQRLDLAVTTTHGGTGSQGSQLGSQQGWSNATIDLNGLNYVDAQVRISAAEINIGETHFAPAAIDAALASGTCKVRFSNLGAYGGQANGLITVDVSAGSPTYALASDFSGVRALPLLQSAAGFDKLDGKMQAKIVVRSAGPSQRAIMSNLAGNVFANFQDGAIRGLNVAGMINSLTSSTLSGWQEGREQNTDLTQLSASFRIEKGQATSTDLNLVGPLVRMTGAGTIDLGTKMLAFRVEPKLVMTTQGQGRTNEPVGLGIPVIIDGPWDQPRIYPEMSGILENPDAAFAKLKQMGQGLFGQSGGGGLGGLGSGLGGLGGLGGQQPASGSGTGNSSGGNDLLGGKLGETLGNLLQQGLGGGQTHNSRAIPAPSPEAQPAPAAATPLPPLPAQNAPAPQAQQDSQPMNDVLRQLFNR